MAYDKISKDRLYKFMVGINLDIFGPGCINLVNIADLLKTSRYQVKKYMDELKSEGMVELVSTIICSEELTPPYWGYQLTKKGVDTDYYREKEEVHNKLIIECFENRGD